MLGTIIPQLPPEHLLIEPSCGTHICTFANGWSPITFGEMMPCGVKGNIWTATLKLAECHTTSTPDANLCHRCSVVVISLEQTLRQCSSLAASAVISKCLSKFTETLVPICKLLLYLHNCTYVPVLFINILLLSDVLSQRR